MKAALQTPPVPHDIAAPRLVFLWKEALLILLCLAVLKAGGNAGIMLVGGLLALWSLRSGTTALHALSLLVPLSSLNIFFTPEGFNGPLKWLGIIIASCAAIFHCLRSYDRLTFPRWLLAFLLFLTIVTLSSLGTSKDVSISLFKLFTFALGVFGVTAICWDRRVSLDYCLSWFYTLFVTVLFASLLFIGSSQYGYLPRTRFFRGILNQSQFYGIYMVPFATYLLARWLFTRSPASPLERIACILGLLTLFMSNARTSMLALLGAMLILFLVGLVRKSIDGQLLLQRLVPAMAVLILLLVAVNAATQGGVVRKLQTFINKNGVQVNSLLGSRETKFNEAYQTFRAHLWTGAGFGMNVGNEILEVKKDPRWGIPISAPVEAGVMYMALPAQIGLIGLLPFLAFSLVFALPILRYAPLPMLGLSTSALLTNMGEYTFFAIGGVGLYLWLVFAFVHRCSAAYGNSGEI